MTKIIRFIIICFYHRFRVIKSCEEAKKMGLMFSHNNDMNSKRSKNHISYWYDEYDILYKVNEYYTSKLRKNN